MENNAIMLSLITLYTIINIGLVCIGAYFYKESAKIKEDILKPLKDLQKSNKKIMKMKDLYKKMYKVNKEVSKGNLIKMDFGNDKE